MAPLLRCLILVLCFSAAVSRMDFYMTFKSDWVRGYSPRHELMINGSHPVAMFTETENKTCLVCKYLPNMDEEYAFLQSQGRYLQTLGDKWRSIVRATIVHTCYFSNADLVCDTETWTNRGRLTVSRTTDTVHGSGTFLQLIDSVSSPGLQLLQEYNSRIRMKWWHPLYAMKARAHPSQVWVGLLRDKSRNLVSCHAYCSSPFPMFVSLVGGNGASSSGTQRWSFAAVNASARSNDMSFSHCRVESNFGWSIVVTHIQDGYQRMRLLEPDQRQEENHWPEETLLVKPPRHRPTVAGKPPAPPKEPRRAPSLWTILCVSSIVLTVVITCLVAFIVICRRYVDEDRRTRRPGDLENNGAVDYMRF